MCLGRATISFETFLAKPIRLGEFLPNGPSGRKKFGGVTKNDHPIGWAVAVGDVGEAVDRIRGLRVEKKEEKQWRGDTSDPRPSGSLRGGRSVAAKIVDSRGDPKKGAPAILPVGRNASDRSRGKAGLAREDVLEKNRRSFRALRYCRGQTADAASARLRRLLDIVEDI